MKMNKKHRGILILAFALSVSCHYSKAGEEEFVTEHEGSESGVGYELKSLKEEYLNYINTYGGIEYEDFSIVGGAELLYNLDSLSMGLKDKIKRMIITGRVDTAKIVFNDFNLDSLTLRGIGLDSLSFLKRLRVKKLDVSLNPVVTIEPLRDNEFIQELDLTGTYLKDLPDMSRMEKLIKIGLRNSLIESIATITTIDHPFDMDLLLCEHVNSLDPILRSNIQKLYISRKGYSPIGGEGDAEGLYDKFEKWFEVNESILKEKNIQILFFYQQSEL